MIDEYSHVIGTKDNLTVIGTAVDIGNNTILIEEDETHEIYQFEPIDVKAYLFRNNGVKYNRVYVYEYGTKEKITGIAVRRYENPDGVKMVAIEPDTENRLIYYKEHEVKLITIITKHQIEQLKQYGIICDETTYINDILMELDTVMLNSLDEHGESTPATTPISNLYDRLYIANED